MTVEKVVLSGKCTGCGVCENTCPHDSIKMEYDEQGFIRPVVNYTTCTDCDACEVKCPDLNDQSKWKLDRWDKPLIYASWNKEQPIRLDSTSGGVYTALARHMFKQGGHVGGAVFQDDHSVHYLLTQDEDRLPDLRSSKYLQCTCDDLYTQVRKLVRKKEKVLVCAAPCQIAGIYSALGKDAENIITVDFICRGINSPKVFLKYMDMLEEQHQSHATKIKFKNKTHGWHRFSTRVDFENGSTYIKDRYTDLYMCGYLRTTLFLRPVCHQCDYRTLPRLADITLADFWGLNQTRPELDNDTGTSLIMINSEKGKAFFEELGDQLTWTECRLDEATGGNLHLFEDPKEDPRRKDFYEDLENLSFPEIAKKYNFNPPGPLKKKILRIRKMAASATKKLGFFRKYLGFSPASYLNLAAVNILRKGTKANIRRGQMLVPCTHSRIDIDKSAKMTFNKGFLLGTRENKKSKMETRFSMGQNSTFTVNGFFNCANGSDIRVFDNAELTIGGGYCTAGVQIVCAKKVTIGPGAAIARDVIIRDTDAHEITFEDGTKHEPAQEVNIGAHVWIGNRAIIMKGVTIGDGAVVAAGSIVTKDVPSRTVVAGVPAKVVRENVDWK